MPQHSSVPEKEIVLFRFRVKSTNPNVGTAMLLQDMSDNEEALETMIAQRVPARSASLKRKGKWL